MSTTLDREEVSRMVAFAAQRLEEDWNTAAAAGHGVTLDAAEHASHLSVPWTRLQAEGNVRLIYDVRFLKRYAPGATINDIEGNVGFWKAVTGTRYRS